MKRRTFIRHSGQAALGLGLIGLQACTGGNSSQTGENGASEEETMDGASGEMFFNISLAQWSLHKTLFEGKLDNLDFAAKAKNDFGVAGVEYVNQFFKDKATDQTYLAEMNKRAQDNGVTNVLIMVDGEGMLGDVDEAARKAAVENHHKWVDAAKYLGCHSIRVNAGGQGTPEEVAARVVESLGSLSEYAATANLNIIVENHGGSSSNGAWLAGVMKEVGMDNCGTLPDFGNFCIRRSGPNPWEGDCVEEYDRYQGVTELMPYAKGVSAKTHDFNEQGQEIHTDYMKMMQIVKDAGYRGWVGVEYEGSELSEEEGIRKTIALLKEVGMKLSYSLGN